MSLAWASTAKKLAQDPILDRAGKLNSDLRFVVAIIHPEPLHDRRAPELSLKCKYRDESAQFYLALHNNAGAALTDVLHIGLFAKGVIGEVLTFNDNWYHQGDPWC